MKENLKAIEDYALAELSRALRHALPEVEANLKRGGASASLAFTLAVKLNDETGDYDFSAKARITSPFDCEPRKASMQSGQLQLL